MIQHTRFINSQFNSNTYLISNEDEASVWIVDPGDMSPIFEWMQASGKTEISGILLTHSHFDHIIGINEIIEKFPKCPIYVANDFAKTALGDPKRNNSYFTGHPLTINKSDNIRTYPNKFTLWDNVEVESFITPGHSEDSVCFIVGNLLFTGDTLIHNLRTVTKLRGGDTVKLRATLDFLRTLSGKGLHVCPGHNEEFEFDGYDLENAVRMKCCQVS